MVVVVVCVCGGGVQAAGREADTQARSGISRLVNNLVKELALTTYVSVIPPMCCHVASRSQA